MRQQRKNVLSENGAGCSLRKATGGDDVSGKDKEEITEEEENNKLSQTLKVGLPATDD